MFFDDKIDPCAETQAACALDQPSEHILIIDDDATQTEILSYRFVRQGYRVSVANSCAKGAAIASADHPDLILLDIRLPDGDGLQTCAEFCDGEGTSDIPIIIISGMETPDVVRQARAAGCQYYVRKPYDPNALLVLAQSAISESRGW